MRLMTKRMGGGWWWIVGDEDDGPYGPYETKADADDDRRGLQRFWDEEWEDYNEQEEERV